MSKTSVIAQTEAGQIVGYFKTPDVIHFRGVPYAAAPYGDLRFKAPQRHPGWEGFRDATNTGPTSPQNEPSFRGPGFNYRAVFSPGWVRGTEILNLNIWTRDMNARAPVMVYIHGGAFDHGNGAVPMYDGTRFAEDGVVLVTINYRLGLEGFLKLEGGDANNAIRDQIAALEWVQRNIANFGGDAGNVTIFGESAGAASVNLLLTAPAAKDLFHKAISQSGLAPSAPKAALADAVAREVSSALGIAPTVDAFRDISQQALLDVVAEVARNASDPLIASEGTLIARPYGDGDVLPLDVRGAFSAGASVGKQVIWGFNTDEATLFTVPNGLHAKATEADVTAFAARVSKNPESLLAFVKKTLGAHATPGQIRDRMQTWSMFGGGTVWAAGEHAALGGQGWLYEFTWKSPQLGGMIGASHLVELPFVFDILNHPNIPAMLGDAAPQSLADDMHSRWVGFAKTGDPGWPTFDRADALSIRFDAPAQLDSHRHDEEAAYWPQG
ncbi:carboxylesterase, type B (plasmid) [Ketogulonicigenium vulgare Y25]|uniref:Carboxylic ester hydrolase n=1 Tax=Ketogulonicigenium vulgare (strain WSH-001) TaxID=759362 RepID=F9YBU0_KETVW|nr:carboxylesterase family protein [Ketogulonicigenium vulgare]ADO44408.1 carboxylesterase, type B [Ketogulonicigenium vulgare Y25]AEM42842.1 Carboxylesterase, type B [Ketogulonicigenium vulgare WSH-001]ALJ82730.1 carboxylesterase [Ketogulonicigenium vulgare]